MNSVIRDIGTTIVGVSATILIISLVVFAKNKL